MSVETARWPFRTPKRERAPLLQQIILSPADDRLWMTRRIVTTFLPLRRDGLYPAAGKRHSSLTRRRSRTMVQREPTGGQADMAAAHAGHTQTRHSGQSPNPVTQREGKGEEGFVCVDQVSIPSAAGEHARTRERSLTQRGDGRAVEANGPVRHLSLCDAFEGVRHRSSGVVRLKDPRQPVREDIGDARHMRSRKRLHGPGSGNQSQLMRKYA